MSESPAQNYPQAPPKPVLAELTAEKQTVCPHPGRGCPGIYCAASVPRRYYTAGYQGHTPAQLLAAVQRFDSRDAQGKPDGLVAAYVVDIRFRPHSPNPAWRQASLRQLLGWHYQHNPGLGNTRYKDGPPVAFADLDGGLNDLLLIPACCPVILLCACADESTCHRAELATILRQRGDGRYIVTPLDWKGNDHAE